jgi:hypothetical protein
MPARDPTYESDYVKMRKSVALRKEGLRLQEEGQYRPAMSTLQQALVYMQAVQGTVAQLVFCWHFALLMCFTHENERVRVPGFRATFNKYLMDCWRVAKALGWMNALDPKHPHYDCLVGLHHLHKTMRK